jgi:methionyl-tRNA synthetase
MDVEDALTSKTLVTSGWPYLHGLPHLGNLVGSILSADVFARYSRLKGEEVVMVSGSDEHGTPVEVEAVRLGVSPRILTDRNHAKIVSLLKSWNVTFDNYTRTESPIHKEVVTRLLMKIYDRGYIFAQETEMLYCEQCNRFLPDRYVEGKCPYCGYELARGDQCENCGRLLETTLLIEPRCTICKSKPVVRHTKHWYFDLPRLSEQIMTYLLSNQKLANSTRNFSLSLVKEGLKPRAITRDVSWGIQAPFPGAENKRIYVWVEAVMGYLSATIEYFKNHGKPDGWQDYWFDREAKTYYFIGKDNIPFHTIILPALLLASGENYNLPYDVCATEWLQFGGLKASKSQKVGIWMDEALELFPADYWRYFLMATRPESKDSDFSWDAFVKRINADLNDTYGNFIHRTLTFINSKFDGMVPETDAGDPDIVEILKTLEEKVKAVAGELDECRLQSATNMVIGISRVGNQYLNEKEPWKIIKKDQEKAANIFSVATRYVKALAIVSAPFMPSAAEEIWKTLNLPGSMHGQSWGEALKPLPPNHKIRKATPLFKKIESSSRELQDRLESIRQRLGKSG